MRLAVFGSPVIQSLSPRIHGLFAVQFGLRIDYRAIEATPETFPGLVTELAEGGGRGCNITAPLKHEAWKLSGRCSESAARARAANTLVFEDAKAPGSANWYADSTDGAGLVNDLESQYECQLHGSRVCLMGAGGAASSVLGALLNRQPEAVFVANRTLQRAEELAKSHSGLGEVDFGSLEDLDSVPPFNLIINATSAGHRGSAVRLSTNWFTEQGFCYDMNYSAAAKPLQEWCSARGIAYSDGLGMLVGQAALSFNLWTGHSPDTRPVMKTLRQETE